MRIDPKARADLARWKELATQELRGGDAEAAETAISALPSLLQETLRQLNSHNRAG